MAGWCWCNVAWVVFRLVAGIRHRVYNVVGKMALLSLAAKSTTV